MGEIGYGYGSEWHLLRYLGYHRQELSSRAAKLVGCRSVDWIDCQFSGVNKPKRQDREWQGVEFLRDPAVKAQWKQFWPSPNQHWDAIGRAHFDDHDEWLMVEAKGYGGELGENVSCGATSPDSIRKIRAALTATQNDLGVEDIPVDCWMSHYYQTCNRYAALHFLRNICQPPVPARLLFIYFYGDPHSGWICPASPGEWEPHLARMDEMTGIRHPNPLSAYSHRLFLPVHPAAGG